eukprot:TRINITY_DN10081_c0_g1_i1.p1 TRINITY_DN10081_c0_g1~~TRINITY_DN10081_c0_g1_i1.p1  ORF type:complete len:444 (-),score=72.00 TRINITY_DN10081_c0_g1_i1:53-1384(-)
MDPGWWARACVGTAWLARAFVLVCALTLLKGLHRALPACFRNPYTPHEITPVWLTAKLRQCGALGREEINVVVASISVSLLAGGERGLTSVLYQLALTYEDCGARRTRVSKEHLPKTIVCKVLNGGLSARMVAVVARFQSEIEFYTKVATSPEMRDVPFRVPRLIHAHHFFGADYMLLMEHVDPIEKTCRTPWPWKSAIDVQEGLMEQILRAMAFFHARFMNSPAIEPFHGASFGAWNTSCMLGLRAVKDPSFAKYFSAYLPQGVQVEDLQRLAQILHKARNFINKPPHTLMHGDLRLENFLWHRSANARTWSESEAVKAVADKAQMILLDWQLCVRGKPAADLGPLFVWELPVEVRRKNEMRWLDMYLTELRLGGVTEQCFSREDLLKSYKISIAVRAFLKVCIMAHSFISSDEQRDKTGWYLHNVVTAIRDLDIESLLQSM